MSPFEEFRQQDHSRARGRAAEDDGVRWLEQQGFRIVARNVQFKAGELDVVAMEDDTLCFVEIKARASPSFGGAVYAVNRTKQRQLAAAASLYLAANAFSGPCRFDVLAMDGGPAGWTYTLVRDAFERF